MGWTEHWLSTSCVTIEISLDLSELWSPQQNGCRKRPSIGFTVKSGYDPPLPNALQSRPVPGHVEEPLGPHLERGLLLLQPAPAHGPLAACWS